MSKIIEITREAMIRLLNQHCGYELPDDAEVRVLSEDRMKEMKYQRDEIKEILYSGEYLGRKFVILNLGTHPTAYVELKPKELEKSENYSDYDLEVHYGFTYLDKAHWDNEDTLTYIGWDYAHCGDYSGIYTDNDGAWVYNLKRWTTQEIFDEVKYVIRQFEDAKWVDCSEPHYILKNKSED